MSPDRGRYMHDGTGRTPLWRLMHYRSDLAEARFSGVQSVRDQSGEMVVYRSQAELEAAIAAVDREIAAHTRTRNPIVYLNASKGV